MDPNGSPYTSFGSGSPRRGLPETPPTSSPLRGLDRTPNGSGIPGCPPSSPMSVASSSLSEPPRGRAIRGKGSPYTPQSLSEYPQSSGPALPPSPPRAAFRDPNPARRVLFPPHGPPARPPHGALGQGPSEPPPPPPPSSLLAPQQRQAIMFVARERRRRMDSAASCEEMSRVCKFCRNNGETPDLYASHVLRNPVTGELICPVLRSHKCEVCGATGADAHTRDGGMDSGTRKKIRVRRLENYCPRLKDRLRQRGQAALPVLLKRTRRQSDGSQRSN